MLVLQRMTHTDPPEYVPCSWATGTDAEIKDALTKHYQGKIDLHNYWNIGMDERVVHLSAMSASDGIESHVEQDVTLVLANAGGLMLADGVTECAFVVCQKNCLANNGTLEAGHISGNPNWDTSKRRTWCDETYRAALPSTTQELFKHFKLVVNSSLTLDAYFALPAQKEISGEDYQGADSPYVSQFNYYNKLTTNKIKYAGDDSSTAVNYWTRTEVNSTSFYYYIASNGGAGTSNDSNNSFGIAPFGVI